ncbi:MAG TPA: Holliday junction branch migration protein RuvA [Chloroflexota bacterium]
MIAFVRGVVASRDGEGVVIDVGGVGLRVEAPTSTLRRFAPGDVAMLHTHLHVREEILALYGFATEEERGLFELLITVNGVGPKMARGVLSALSAEQLRGAISRGNDSMLTVVPGIGKRLAQRIVIDLRDKVGPRAPSAGEPGLALAADDPDAHVLEALTAVFGYTPLQAAQAIAALPADAPSDPQERIGAALRYFSGPR